MIILNILLFLVVLGGIILIHEFGHFYFARKAGILVHEFAIGMGPLVYGKRGKDDILYAVRGIPIGGYVSMAGEEVSDAMIKKGQKVGLHLGADGIVDEIHTLDVEHQPVVGIVKDYDLYGQSMADMFVTLTVDDQGITYQVKRTCKYILKNNQYMKVTPEEQSFESKTLWQRFLTIFGGPLMNFVLAFVLYLIVAFFVFQPQLDSNAIGDVIEGYPASSVGIVAGDKITSINGLVVNDWNDLGVITSDLASHVVDIEVEKENGNVESYEDVSLAVVIQTGGFSNIDANGEILDRIAQTFGRAQEAGLGQYDVIYELSQGTVTQDINDFDDVIAFFQTVNAGDVTVKYYANGSDAQTLTYTILSESALSKLGYESIAFQFGITATTSFNLGYSLLYPFKMIGNNVSQVYQTLGLLLSPNEDIGLSDLSGPIGIFTLVSRTSSQGLLAILAFTAFLSINIGILNLLPIPALDGGRLVFLAYEGITRKRLSKKLENTVNMIMFYALMILFVYVTYHDIIRIIRGLI
ncbi:MAG: RIP metalloprotease RseP [Acholeplasmataceae bacterium]